jgi:hypothetical protein
MAGTRLLIVVSFVFPLSLFIIVICIGIGLGPQDLLLIRLRHEWTRAIERLLLTVEFQRIYVPNSLTEPTLVIYVPEMPLWDTSVKRISLIDEFATVVAVHPEHFHRCSSPDDSRTFDTVGHTTSYIWICEDGDPRLYPRVRIQSNHTAFLYPSQDLSSLQVLQLMFPKRILDERPQSMMQLRLFLDPSVATHWKEYFFKIHDALDTMQHQWIENYRKAHLANLCSLHIELDPWPISHHSTPSMRNASHDFWSIRDISPILSSTTHRMLHFYVPSRPTLFFYPDNGYDTSTRLAIFGNRSFLVILESHDKISPLMYWIQNELLMQCLGLPSDHSLLRWETPVEANETLPRLPSISARSFYERLLFIRAIWLRYSVTLRNIDRMRSIVQSNGHRWNILSDNNEPIVDPDRFQSTFLTLVQNERYDDVLSLLQDMEDRLDQWFQSNQPHARVVTDFPREQYAAILGPLLFPLLVPIFAACFREYLRYRKMIRNK